MGIFETIFPAEFNSVEEVISFVGGILISFILGIAISLTYKISRQKIKYDRDFATMLIMLTLVTTILMSVVSQDTAGAGAVAFGLLGLLSLIRFRAAIKDVRDVGFILWAAVIGTTVGFHYNLNALLSTLLMSVIIIVISLFEKEGHLDTIIKITGSRADESSFKEILDIFSKYNVSYSLVGKDVKIDKFKLEYLLLKHRQADEEELVSDLLTSVAVEEVSLAQASKDVKKKKK